MNDDRKKPGVAAWGAASLFVALVLYPVSWGPFVRLQSSGVIPKSLLWIDRFYDPARWIIDASPVFVSDTCKTYLYWWIGERYLPNHIPESETWE